MAASYGAGGPPPPDFTATIGYSLLCINTIEDLSFYSWLNANLGKPFRHRGGAWWFSAEGLRLFGLPVEAVFVDDRSSRYRFIGAVLKLDAGSVASRLKSDDFVFDSDFRKIGEGNYLTRMGSHLISYGPNKSKIFCAVH